MNKCRSSSGATISVKECVWFLRERERHTFTLARGTRDVRHGGGDGVGEAVAAVAELPASLRQS
jgi:hypothetical protein